MTRLFPDAVEQIIAAKYAAGYSSPSVAEEFGTTPHTVLKIAHRRGFGVRRRGGSRSSQWRGGRKYSIKGYVQSWVAEADPMACMKTRYGYVPEHRLVMARHLERPLTRQETVHHINGDKADNRIENLQLRSGQHGAYQAIGCMDCGSHRIGPVRIAEAA